MELHETFACICIGKTLDFQKFPAGLKPPSSNLPRLLGGSISFSFTARITLPAICENHCTIYIIYV